MKWKLSYYNFRITENPDEQRNIATTIKANSFSMIYGTLHSVSLVQAFLITQGISNAQLGIMNSISQLLPLLTSLFLIGVIDGVRKENLVSFDRMLVFSTALFPMTYIILSILVNIISTNAVFSIALISTMFVSLINSLRPIVNSKIIKRLYIDNIYGSVSGLSGIICYLISILTGLIARIVLNNHDSPLGYSVIFSFSLAALVVSAYFIGRLKLIRSDETEGTIPVRFSLSFIVLVLKDKYMLNLSLLHIIRGIYGSVLFFILPIGVRYYQLELKSAITITILTSVAGLLSYIIILLFYDKIGTKKMISYASANMLVSVVGFALFLNSIAFFLFYIILSIGVNLLAIAIPLGVINATPLKYLGLLTGLRLFLMSVFSALFSTISGIMIDNLSLYVILLTLFFFFFAQSIIASKAFPNEISPVKGYIS